jgi:hypothetical protein
MRELCSQCNICNLPDEGLREVAAEKLSRDINGGDPAVLIIADARKESIEILQLMHLDTILNNLPYTYTRVIRCENDGASDEKRREAESKCAVWTHHLLNNRRVIITVPKGLKQMGIEGKAVGDLFRSNKYGIILVIDRFSEISTYHAKIQRALREAGLDE